MPFYTVSVHFEISANTHSEAESRVCNYVEAGTQVMAGGDSWDFEGIKAEEIPAADLSDFTVKTDQPAADITTRVRSRISGRMGNAVIDGDWASVQWDDQIGRLTCAERTSELQTQADLDQADHDPPRDDNAPSQAGPMNGDELEHGGFIWQIEDRIHDGDAWILTARRVRESSP